MPPIPKRWEYAPAAPVAHLHHLSDLHPLVVQVLYNRGIVASDEIRSFLQPAGRYIDPFRLLGMRAAVDRIRTAIRAEDAIVVYGDFDADGVTATALLVQALSAFGARVSHYIPDRVDEGYGLNVGALDGLHAAGARLIITVDCGIRSVGEVRHANALGLDMIVTDHHTLGADLPPAFAVINPKQPNSLYPFRDLAGVGIAFKLAQALLLAEWENPLCASPIQLDEGDLLDLVAIGTVADLAPLLGENRSLVRRGLAELNKPRRPGVQAMLAEASLEPGKIDATAIGFVLGPRINAAGRLSSAEKSYALLTAPDVLAANQLAEELGQINSERQRVTREMVELATARMGAAEQNRYLYLLADPDFQPGIVGLVAGRLAEELYRPVLIAEQGEATTHGSARSIPEFNITAALDECADLLERYGGHAAAAGFTVKNEFLPALRARLEEIAARELADSDLQPAVTVDATVALGELDWGLHAQLAALEPFGYANPQPILASHNLEVATSRQVGADRRHLKLTLCDPGTGLMMDAIAFRQGDWYGVLPKRIDVAYSLEVNEFRGKRSLQLNIQDMRPATI